MQQQEQLLAGPIPTVESGVGPHMQPGLAHQGVSFQSQKQVELDSERNPRQDR